MNAIPSTSIARKARTRAEADFATWLMMAKLGSFDDLPEQAQKVLTGYRGRLERMNEIESKVVAVREIYQTYYAQMGGTGIAPEPEPELRKPGQTDNVVRFQKPAKPAAAKPSAARFFPGSANAAPGARRPVPALLIFAAMVALIAAWRFLVP